MNIDIKNGDCLELLKTIPDNSIDLVLTDPPYGATACKWDIVIPFDLMWNELKRVTKKYGNILLFGSDPFSLKLKASNLEDFKYDLIWIKNSSNFTHAKNMPLKNVELISVFSKASIGHKSLLGEKRMTYNPQGLIKSGKKLNGKNKHSSFMTNRPSHKDQYIQEYTNYPKQTLEFKAIASQNKIHTSQKPVDLLEYLIKTYSNENETVLDFTMGSGSTGVSCVKTNRNFIGFELDSKYYEIAKQRIDEQLTSVKTDDTIQEDNLSDW